MSKATGHWCLRGFVLDTQFGPRYDVTQLLVLTLLRQDFSAGKCLAHMILHDTTTRAHAKIFPPVLPSQTCFIVLAFRGNRNTLVNRGRGTCRESKLLRHSNFTIWGYPCRQRTLFLDAHRIARKCAATGGRCSVSGHQHVHPKASASRSEIYWSRDHTRPHRLSFALAMVLTTNARRHQ